MVKTRPGFDLYRMQDWRLINSIVKVIDHRIIHTLCPLSISFECEVKADNHGYEQHTDEDDIVPGCEVIVKRSHLVYRVQAVSGGKLLGLTELEKGKE